MNINLKSIKFIKILSLQNIPLSVNQLTIITGANASGKSNILAGFKFLSDAVNMDTVPPVSLLTESAWAGGIEPIGLELAIMVDDTQANYQLEIALGPAAYIRREHLELVDGNTTQSVINISNGSGYVYDEGNSIVETPFNPAMPKIALGSAGDYGNRPVTSAIQQFMASWTFYHLQPNIIRSSHELQHFFQKGQFRQALPSTLDDEGAKVAAVLARWQESMPDKFELVNTALVDTLGLSIHSKPSTNGTHTNGHYEFFLDEGYQQLIPLSRASDGTLRLLAYLILLNQDTLPPLIAIEEPEQNLHPNTLPILASYLAQLSKRTQVIITTHSVQLLDAFEPSSNIAVLLLKNRLGQGTHVLNVLKERHRHPALDGWIDDFGMGSAIFESELIDDLLKHDGLEKMT
ncbi:MAG: AAA family ATPase [Chloroflexota bacterium]